MEAQSIIIRNKIRTVQPRHAPGGFKPSVMPAISAVMPRVVKKV